MTHTDRPDAGHRVHCAHDSTLIPTIRMNDRATKNPADQAGPSDLVIATEENKS